VAAANTPSPAPQPADADSEARRLQGKWIHWRSEDAGGVSASCADFMLLDGDFLQFVNGGAKGATARFTVDATKDPKEIELNYTSGSQINRKHIAIWRMPVEGVLEVCWAPMDETKRPRKFTARLTPGAGASYDIYRKEGYQEPEEIVREKKKFEGRWVSAANAGDGVLIEEDVMQFLWGGNNKGAVVHFTVDPSKTPKEIEFVYTRGSENRKRRIGIYRLDGNKLELCMSQLDGERLPKKFTGPGTPGGGDVHVKYILKEK
jgi:uncharacterized protein (TIGR03067 family)